MGKTMSSHFLRYFYLDPMRTCIISKSLDEFEMRPLVYMATDRVTVEKTALSRFLECFYWIHFILAGNDDLHKSLNEFEIRRDPTLDYGVGCP